MNNFFELFKKEAISTIEGLTGQTPTVELRSTDTTIGSIVPPMSIAHVKVSGDGSGQAAFFMPPVIATALADMMLGGMGDSKESMDDEDLDAAKEIVNNILGAISTTLGAQKELPKLAFSVENMEYIDEFGSVDTSAFGVLATFDLHVGEVSGLMLLGLDKSVWGTLNPSVSSTLATSHDSHASTGAVHHQLDVLSAEEQKNIQLLLDVRLTVRVRIGSKRMLLRDVINMDLGSVVELDQLVNEPLDILVEDKKIAEGEVVIVDGNFGIQITTIDSKRERLESLRG